MISQDLVTFKIAGEAGQGIKSAGILFARFASRSGYHAYNYIEYPSIIRGGHNVMQINVSKEVVTGPRYNINFLIALNQESIDFHVDELTENAGVLFDGDDKLDLSRVEGKCKLFPIPLSKLAKDAGGGEILINTVAVGATCGLYGGNLDLLKELLGDEYGDKGEKVVQINHNAAELAYKYAQENFKEHVCDGLKHVDSIANSEPRILINGNEAVALGAIHGGVQFAAIYPMSPISNILHVLAKHQEEFGYVYKQPEDEIAAINMAIGASIAGARSMTVTSGGGFCLMAEGYGLAGITETPLFIVEGMRGGPATGLPTWSEQGDLRMILHAHQSDWPRIVLSAGDAQEAFYMSMEALNLAERYQTTVVLIIDKNICENDQTFSIFDTSEYKVDRGKLVLDKVEDFKRYELSDDGISPRTIPGLGNFFIANSDEHDEYGISSEDIENRNVQMNKRMRKLDICAQNDMPKPVLYGPEDADLTFVSWGSNKGSILQAIKKYDNVNYLHITWMNPFPTEEVKKVLESAKYVVHVECSFSAQLAGYIREKTGIETEDKLLKYDGRPFYVEEIEEKINSVLKGGQS